MPSLPKKILISYSPFPRIIAGLSCEFQKLGIETVAFYTTDHENCFSQRIIRFVNKWLHNLRITKKTTDIFEKTRYNLHAYLASCFQKAVLHHQPDAILMIHGRPFAEDFLSTLTVPKVGWWIEPYDKAEQLVKMAKAFDIYNSYSAKSVALLKEHGFDARYLSHAVDPRYFYKKECPKLFDIVFVGNWSPWRDDVLEAALEVTSNIALYGPNWKRKSRLPKEKLKQIYKGKNIIDEALNTLFNASSIVLNASREKKSSGLNMRFFEAVATGSLFLTDGAPELNMHFSDNQHLVVYDNTDELKAKLTALLKDKQLLGSIAEAGRLQVIGNHQYSHTAKFFLEQFESV